MAAMNLYRRLACEKGAELIEFALVFPLLLLVMFGIMDFGLLFQRYETVTNAAREGARRDQRHEVRFRARVREANELEVRHPRAHRFGESELERGMASHVQTEGERFLDGAPDDGMRVPVHPGGVLREEIDVLMAVGIPQAGPFPVDEPQGKRGMKEHCPRVAPRKVP
jgi:hypothetical protein